MRSICCSLLAAVAVTGSGCGSKGAGGDPDAGPDGGTDGTAGFLIVGNGVEPCRYLSNSEVCPADRNRELFRFDFDAATGDVREIRLTDDSDGVAPPSDGSIAPDDDFFLAVSPDAEWVYYHNRLDGNADFYRVRADGSSSAPELLTASDPAGEDYFWGLSRDGATIWFESDRDGAFDLYRMNADGSGVENLTRSASDWGEGYRVLPDESGMILRVGDYHDPDGIDADGEIYRFRFDGGERIRLTDNRVNDVAVGLTPDGAQLIVQRFDDDGDDGVPDGGNNLWVVPTDGSAKARRVTSFTTGTLTLKAITPDGARAVFERRESGIQEVYSVALGGGEPIRVSSSPGGESSYFRVLSGDGQTIYFTTNDRPGGAGDTEIFAVATAGGTPRLLTDFDNTTYFMPDAELTAAGTLLYHSPLDGDLDLFVVPIDGGPAVDLTANDWDDSLVGLSANGRFFYYSNFSVDPIYLPDGNLSPESDEEIFLGATDGSGEPLQITDNEVYDHLDAVVLPPGP